MKIYKLILKETIPTIFISLLVLTFFAFTKEIQRFSEMLIVSGISFFSVARLLLTILPSVIFITLPMALIIGIISCFSRLGTDSETKALKACGISVMKMFHPVIVIAVSCFVLTFLCTTIISPYANNSLRKLQFEIAITQISSEIQPRVFIEKFKNFVFYIEDIDRKQNLWKGIFIADKSNRNNQKIYLARQGQFYFVPEKCFIQLHLEKGVLYCVSIDKPDSDSLTSFGSIDIPLKEFNVLTLEQIPKRNIEKSTFELRKEIELNYQKQTTKPILNVELEYYSRFALPFACLIFAIVGFPIGVCAKFGGRSTGFILALMVVFLYYLIYTYLWKIGIYYHLYTIKYGVWGANFVLLFLGVWLLWLVNRERHPITQLLNIPFLAKVLNYIDLKIKRIIGKLIEKRTCIRNGKQSIMKKSAQFARVMDRYVIREFLIILSLTIFSSLTIVIISTLFELIDEIWDKHIPFVKVIEYFFFLWPMVFVNILPLCILISVLICLGLMEKNNQIMVLKTAGVSLYRISLPIVCVVLIIVPLTFALQEFIMPYSNQRQDNLNNEIRGKKIKTFYRSDMSWVMGRNGKVYNYSFFNRDRDQIADLSIFQVDILNASIDQRIFSNLTIWDNKLNRWHLYDGWERKFGGASQNFKRFKEYNLDIEEKPTYFKEALKQSDKLSFFELSDYIKHLKTSGFDTLGLEVDLYKKISYPIVNFIMLFIGIPFSFKMGKRGALFGMVISVMIGITFWALFNLFSAMGAYGILPPSLAAWAPILFFGFAGLYLILNMRT